MNILLTNDDGYNSLGIKILKKKLEKYGTVLIVAPDSPRSGNSAALSLTNPIQLEKVETKSSFEKTCEKVCPYILLVCMIILCVLLFIALVKYGHAITGTEANGYYYHLTE